MCGRYADSHPPEFIARLFRTVNALPNIGPSWNIAPTQQAMVVRRHPETGERHLDLLQWGLVPHWTKNPAHAKTKPINARAETVTTSGMFRGAFAQRRCLVPAEAFYEWKELEGVKQPYAIARQDGAMMVFAGLWEGYKWPSGEVTRTFTIITTSANTDMAGLHDRMPVILEPPDWPVWLGEVEDDPATLLRPSPDGTLRMWPVSRAVNTPRNNSAELLEPITA
jgi:putative SOS response-associated peptidase YedK